MTNAEIAAVFDELAALTRIADGTAQSFRARAYESATKTIRGLPQAAAELSAADLRRVPGIGKSTASMIREYVENGRLGRLETLRRSTPRPSRSWCASRAWVPSGRSHCERPWGWTRWTPYSWRSIPGQYGSCRASVRRRRRTCGGPSTGSDGPARSGGPRSSWRRGEAQRLVADLSQLPGSTGPPTAGACGGSGTRWPTSTSWWLPPIPLR